MTLLPRVPLNTALVFNGQTKFDEIFQSDCHELPNNSVESHKAKLNSHI